MNGLVNWKGYMNS